MGVPKALDFWVDMFSIIIAGMAKGLVQGEEVEEADMNFTNKKGESVTANAYRFRANMDGKEFMNWVLKIGGYSDLKGLLEDPRFKQLPLYNPTLSLQLYFIPKEILETEGPSDFIEAHHSFDTSKNAISKIGKNQIFVNQGFGFQVYLPIEDMEHFNAEALRNKSKATIGHELTHAYEGYQRSIKSGDPYQGQESFLNAASKIMRDDKYPQWKNFLHLIYLHLGFEINARITQFYYQIKDKDIETTEEFLKDLKASSVWQEVKMLEDFNAEDFVNSFKVGKLNFMDRISDIGKQIERKAGGLPAIYYKKDPKEGMKHLIQGWDFILQFLNTHIAKQGVYKGKLMDLVPNSALENPYNFFKFFEKRFHKKAKRFKKKLYRIGSLAIDKSLIGEN